MSVIDDYLKNQATPTQAEHLQKIRDLTLKMVPEPEELITYGIPTIKYKGKFVIYFAAFKNHMSVYPIPNDEIRAKLKDFKTSEGTIQFTEAKPIPEAIIKEMINLRLKAIDAGAKDY